MKKITHITLIFLATFIQQTQAQTQYHTFGDMRVETSRLLYPQSSKSVFVAGQCEDVDGGKRHFFITNLTEEGTINWYKTYSDTMTMAICDWIPAKEGGLMVLAEQYYLGNRETLYLMKLSNDGNIEWTSLFDEGGNEVEGLSITTTKDGGYIIGGLMKEATIVSDVFFAMRKEKKYAYMLKVDAKGKKQWSKKINYENEATAKCWKVIETKDGYLFSGVINAKDEQENTDVLLVKLSTKGDCLWSTAIGGKNNEVAKNMVMIKDELFVVGSTSSFGEGNSDGFLMCLNKNGSVKYFKTYGGSNYDALSSITVVDDNTLLLGGDTKSFGNDYQDALLLTVNKNSEVLLSETFGNEKIDQFASATISNNKLYMAGSCFMSKVPKSMQGYLVSTPYIAQLKPCFNPLPYIASKNYSTELIIKYLDKKLLTNVMPAKEQVKFNISTTIVKTKNIQAESFCK